MNLRSLDAGAALDEPHEVLRCDVCDQLIEGNPAGQGVYLWSRGDEVRYEPAPLCTSCATAIGLAAIGAHEPEEEEG